MNTRTETESPKYRREDFELLPHPNTERYPDEFRIRHIPTGEESQYYCKTDCQDVIRLACAGALKGSFLS